MEQVPNPDSPPPVKRGAHPMELGMMASQVIYNIISEEAKDVI